MKKNETEKKKWNARNIIGTILFGFLIISLGYTVAHIITAPNTVGELDSHTRLKSDYILMFLQCILGLTVMLIPSIIEKKLSFTLPNYMSILYFLFLFCAIYLGEVRNFYYVSLLQK